MTAIGRMVRRGLGAIAAALAVLLAGAAAAADAPLVAAAADLRFALSEIAERFRRDTGAAVRLVFGSSGNFARQIRQGAPFELYLSADEDYVLELARDGFTKNEGALYAIGRVVLKVPTGSPLSADGSLEDLVRAVVQLAGRRELLVEVLSHAHGLRALPREHKRPVLANRVAVDEKRFQSRSSERQSRSGSGS